MMAHQPSRNTLSFKLLTALVKLFLPHSTIRNGSGITWALVGLLGMSLVEQYLISRIGSINGGFYALLTASETWDVVSSFLLEATVTILIIAVVKSLCKSLVSFLALQLRTHLTTYLHTLYLTNRHHPQYKIPAHLHAGPVIDNPDQRVSQDVQLLCNNLAAIIYSLDVIPFQVAYYSVQCWQLLGWFGPPCIYVFFLMGTYINGLAAKPVVPLVVQQEANEGDLRFRHTRVRCHSESVAFMDGEALEKETLDEKFHNLYKTTIRLIRSQLVLNCSTEFFVYLGSILNFVLLSLQLAGGSGGSEGQSETAKRISESSFATLMLIFSFTSIISLFSQLSDTAGYAHRITQLVDAVKSLDTHSDADTDADTGDTSDSVDEDKHSLFPMPFAEANYIALQSVSIFTPPPSSLMLIKDLTFEVTAGKNMLVMGPSGCGKSSLLRVLKGLWKFQGTITRPRKGIMFVPQEAYLYDNGGSVLNELHYGAFNMARDLHVINNSSSEDDKNIKEENDGSADNEENRNEATENTRVTTLLIKLGLGGLLTRCEAAAVVWENRLSPGERQRLMMARVLYSRPSFAIVDEITSHVDEEVESLFYNECRRMGITLISVGHRPSLMRFHDLLLQINGNGEWTLSHINVHL